MNHAGCWERGVFRDIATNEITAMHIAEAFDYVASPFHEGCSRCTEFIRARVSADAGHTVMISRRHYAVFG